MTFGLSAVLEIIAVVLLVVAALGVPSGRVSLGWLGVAFHCAAALMGMHA